MTNFRLFQLKKLTDNNFKFDANGRKFSKRIDNTVGKGEMACYDQFLIFPQCFENTYTAGSKNTGFFGKGLNEELSLKLF